MNRAVFTAFVLFLLVVSVGLSFGESPEDLRRTADEAERAANFLNNSFKGTLDMIAQYQQQINDLSRKPTPAAQQEISKLREKIRELHKSINDRRPEAIKKAQEAQVLRAKANNIERQQKQELLERQRQQAQAKSKQGHEESIGEKIVEGGKKALDKGYKGAESVNNTIGERTEKTGVGKALRDIEQGAVERAGTAGVPEKQKQRRTY